MLSAKHLVARTPPTVSLTAPLNNSTVYDSLVSHATALTATVSGNHGVARVQFRVGGKIIATDKAAPYSASWDTTSVADGPHTLTVIATDGAGNTTTTTGTVTVVHDRTPPTVSLTAPLNNSTVYDSLVSHATALTATVSDSQSGVASVQFRVDGTPLATATPTGPNTYSASWDTTSVADGSHTLTVIATDGAGNTTTTTGTVTVVHDHPILIPTPGSPLVESGLFASLNVSWDEYGHAIVQTTTLNPFTGATQITSTLLTSNLVNGIPTVVPGVTGDDPSRPLTLAYHLPTPVQGGDVAVYNFQTGQLSDLIRFQTVSDPVVGTQGWMLIYSDAPAAGETEAPADVGVPTPTHSVLTQSAIEFGVEGYDVVEYAAEQATYSGLSDGNLIPFGSA